MNNSPELQHLKKCLELIESKLGRGLAQDWTGYDFEKLSIEIQEATAVVLSVTTLKRLWGRLKYTSMPAITTLNTLAKFLGYKDWRDFKNEVPGGQAEQSVLRIADAKKNTWNWKYGLMGLSLLLIAVCVLLLTKVGASAHFDFSDYTFSSNKIKTEGLPNSVIFNYDARAADADSVFIAQSWDVSRKVSVPKMEHTYSAIYYQPGYYRAKLIVGSQIVKEHDLMISSDGWLAMIYKNGDVPLYFKKNEVLKEHEIQVNEELLSKYNVLLQPSLPALRFYNVRDLGALKNDNFIFETMVKSEFQQGTAACQRVEVLILCKNDVIAVPLCSKGCIGDIYLYAAGKEVLSKRADLSGFGCDLGRWVKLRVESHNRDMRFFVNGLEAYRLKFSNKPSDIIGLQYRFNGTGAVKDTRFINEGQVIDF